MIDEHYPFELVEQDVLYAFWSKGNQGRVMKIILFAEMPDGLWNLGFGALIDGKIDDTIVLNNDDLRLTMKTVIAAAYRFSEKFPDRIIHAEPVDERRKSLYNLILRLYSDEITRLFSIDALFDKKWVPYTSRLEFDAFRFARKASYF